MTKVTFLHLELTRRCPIECPKCPRTIEKGAYKANTDINLSTLKTILDGQYLDLIVCSGTLGDPIYHPDIFNILEFLKTKCKEVKLHTNGSGKKDKWWQTFYGILRDTDKIIFGLDGLKDTNQLYRKNQDWSQVFRAMQIGKKYKKNIIWQWIPFRFNEDQISEARFMAKRYGIQFLLLKSHRWEENDQLKPLNKNLVANNNVLDLLQ